MEVLELTDGGQTADRIAARAAEFLRSARRSLEIALYDLRLPGAPGDLVADALREAATRRRRPGPSCSPSCRSTPSRSPASRT